MIQKIKEWFTPLITKERKTEIREAIRKTVYELPDCDVISIAPHEMEYFESQVRDINYQKYWEERDAEMKKWRDAEIKIILAVLLTLSTSVFADSYNTYGSTIYGSDGTTYNRIGNTTFGSDGSSYSTYGNTTYGSNGKSYSTYGNTTYGSDGTTYNRIGNTTYGSNGSSCSRFGSTTYCH